MGGLAVFPSKVFGVSADFQVDSLVCGLQGFSFSLLLFASLLSLSFLVFVLTLLMVLLAF